jgi:predicted N-acyltransferase
MESTAQRAEFEAEFVTSLSQVPAALWNGICGTDYPFLRHEFLHGLETSQCTSADTGWQPCHLVLRQDEDVVALMPLYLKSHSYGEYVFDWSWSDAWRQSGLNYYPKLLTAIPFTPATGPRLCLSPDANEALCTNAAIRAVENLARQQKVSSWHLLFPEEKLSETLLAAGMHRRAATQFHWFNEGYDSFDDFLSTFNSRKRKSLKKERRQVAEQGLELNTRVGNDIREQDWDRFHHFYQLTYAKRSGHGGYLTREFFLDTAAGMGDQVVMVQACLDGNTIAAALYFRSSDTLYGRYWGCERELDFLHFEACYYQGIEYCIANKLRRFDPGAQGEHKIQRGFRPTTTWSNHWIADPALSAAVGDFTRREEQHNEHYRQSAAEYLPFK